MTHSRPITARFSNSSLGLFLALILVTVQACSAKKEPARPAGLIGSWRWVKSWDKFGERMTPDSTGQRLVVTFRPDSTYDIVCNDTLTAQRIRYFTKAASVACRPGTVVRVMWYEGLDGHQIIDLPAQDTLVLIALDHERLRESMYSLYYRHQPHF